jgi:type IV pilus assembly protein PilN
MIRINLIPVAKARKQEALILQAVAAVIVLGVVGVGCYFVTVGKQAMVTAKEQEIAQKKRDIEDLKQKVGEVEKYKQQAQTLEQQLGVIRALEKSRSGPVKLMDELTEMVPKKLWLSVFREQNKAVTVEGMAESGPVIADFLDSLKTAKYFSNVQLTSVTAADQSGAKVHKFVITINVKYDI